MIIDDKFTIDKNGTLTFAEMREIEKKDGTKEMGMYKENYYYPNTVTALKKYLDLQLLEATDVKYCVQLIEETYAKIEALVK